MKVLLTCFKESMEGGLLLIKSLNLSFNHKSLSKYKKEYLFIKIVNIRNANKNNKNKTGPPLVNRSSSKTYTFDNK